jgi:hypothetical protein
MYDIFNRFPRTSGPAAIGMDGPCTSGLEERLNEEDFEKLSENCVPGVLNCENSTDSAFGAGYVVVHANYLKLNGKIGAVE